MTAFLIVLLCLVLLILAVSYICFFLAFYVPKRMPKNDSEYDLPTGEVYKPFHKQMIAWIDETRARPFTEYSITSFDGLKLYAKFYEYEKGAPIEIMFHGYRGTAERDLCGGVSRSFALGRSVLLVDQRGAGKSEGRVITFGVKESRDCLSWVDFAVKQFGNDSKLILTGISMGAATVIMAAENPLPPNVIGILADCGYSSAPDMIKKTIRELKLPSSILYPFVVLGGLIFGGFNIEKAVPLKSIAKCTLPVFFVHGESDTFVPCEMSKLNFEACPTKKILHTVKGADHGLAFPVDPDGYIKNLNGFFY